jgi:hypothetical protein
LRRHSIADAVMAWRFARPVEDVRGEPHSNHYNLQTLAAETNVALIAPTPRASFIVRPIGSAYDLHHIARGRIGATANILL